MSGGTPIVTLRIEETLQEAMQIAIDGRNAHTSNAPWTVSDFIRRAISEKLEHMQRSRRPRRRPQPITTEELQNGR